MGNDPLILALDAMGGDQAPAMVVAGAELGLERFPGIQFHFFGDSGTLEPLLAARPRLKAVSTLIHAKDVIGNDMKPGTVLRQGRASSMRLAIDAVAEGRASAIISAGNTGALMALAKFALRTLPGIDRPAIASFFPTERGESVMLDLGANIECDSHNLVQFALLGAGFARTILGINEPTVGLLNVGAEELKGHDDLKSAHTLLRDTVIPGLAYHGFVEGNDIPGGTVDVIVTDGFTGNVALKIAEGTSKLYSHFLRQTFAASIPAKIGYLFAKGAFGRLRLRVDPRRYNGAPLLGLKGICVKSHGGTDHEGFANAVGVAVDLVRQNFNERIGAELAHLPSPAPAAAHA